VSFIYGGKLTFFFLIFWDAFDIVHMLFQLHTYMYIELNVRMFMKDVEGSCYSIF